MGWLNYMWVRQWGYFREKKMDKHFVFLYIIYIMWYYVIIIIIITIIIIIIIIIFIIFYTC